MILMNRIKKMTSEQIQTYLYALARKPYSADKEARMSRFRVWHALCQEYVKRHGDDQMDELLDKLEAIIIAVNNLEVSYE